MDFENATKTSEGNCFHCITSETIPTLYNVLYTVALSIIALYGGISNTLLLYGSIRTTVKYNSTQKLFLVLTVGDLWTAVVAVPVQIYIVNSEHKLNCLSSSIQVFTVYHTSWNSGLTISVISLTRYVTVATKRLKEFLGGKAFALAVFLNFSLALALSFWLAFSFYYKLFILVSLYYFLAGSFALTLLTGVIVLNSKLISFLRKIRSTSVTAKSRYQIKVAKTVLLIIIAQTFNSWSNILVYLNCGVGPSIYIVSSGLMLRLWKNLSKKRRLANKISI